MGVRLRRDSFVAVLSVISLQIITSKCQVGRAILQANNSPSGTSAPACAGDNYVTANAGDTLSQIAVGMGGNGCVSQQQYLSQLQVLNPQIANVDDGLIPGDQICFPRQNGFYGRRRLQQLRVINPNRNHLAPPNCPPQQVGYAERGDTLTSIAQDFHCLKPGSPSLTSLVQRLRELNPGVASPDTALDQGTRICVTV